MEKLRRPGIEYSLTEHCNLSCHGCNHASPLFPERFAEVGSFERDLLALEPHLRAEELRIVGGEPLIHPRLLDFLRIGRAVGIAERIVLYTNGIALAQAPRQMWELIDELWVSLYPKVSQVLSVEALAVIAADHGVKLRPYTVDSFFLTLLNSRVDPPRLVAKVFEACDLSHAWSCHAIDRGRYYKCAQAPFLEYRLSLRGIEVKNRSADGIALHDNPDLRGCLERYLADSTPLQACEWCLGTSGPKIPHRLVGSSGRQAWIEEDHRAAIDETRRRLLGDQS